jgi:branched-chain amino acid transport system ATP-binding protein
MLGANGAGKTTTLRRSPTCCKGERGEVTKGTIEYKGERVDQLTPADLVRAA